MPPVPEHAAPVHGPPTAVLWVFAFLFVLGMGYGIPRLIFLPYGLILSIFTLIVLERATVKALYQRSAT
jgi:hypothetical protein